MSLLSNENEISRSALSKLDQNIFENSRQIRSYEVEDKEACFQSLLKTYSFPNTHTLTRNVLAHILLVVRAQIPKHLKILRGLKLNLMLFCNY